VIIRERTTAVKGGAGELWVILTNDKNVFRGNATKIAR